MKLLLTSGGFANGTIIGALKDLAPKPLNELNLAFIPTAANLEIGGKWWLIKDLESCQNLGFNSVDIVDVSALPKNIWLERLKSADIILIGGGNTYHLMHWINQSGLDCELPELLETRIYVGISAGSLVVTPSIINSHSEKQAAVDIGETAYDKGLALVDFMVEPHINNQYFPELTFESVEKDSRKYQYPIYALDDNSAVKVNGSKIEIVSEGEWKMFEK